VAIKDKSIIFLINICFGCEDEHRGRLIQVDVKKHFLGNTKRIFLVKAEWSADGYVRGVNELSFA